MPVDEEPTVEATAANLEPNRSTSLEPSAALRVQRSGTGRPILFIHGLGASGRYWRDDTSMMTRGQAIVPDLLGFGRSPAPPAASYDITGHLESLAPLVDEGTTVVGHSVGAILAAALAAAHPRRVVNVLLVGLPAFPDEATARAEIGRLSMLARLTVEEHPAARWLCAAMCRMRPLAIAAAPLMARDMPRRVAADGARHTWQSYSRTLRHVVVEHRVRTDLARVTAPITFIHGRQDRTAPTPWVRALATELRQSGQRVRLTEVDGDHHLPLRRPEVLARAIDQLAIES